MIFADGFESGDLGCWSTAGGDPGNPANCSAPPTIQPATTEPLYSSEGLLQALFHTEGTAGLRSRYLFYFAGRPVAQLLVSESGPETWTYLTTDHLGTPVAATDAAGALTWQGGFEPFGEDWQAGTPVGASENGIPLRLPGQWTDGTWQEASLGVGVYYNVWRWLEPGTGRYTRPDPLGFVAIEGATNLWSYAYADSNPINASDPVGLYTIVTKDPDFRQRVEDGFEQIQEGLPKTCCERYFSDRSVELPTWSQPGGPPYIVRADGRLRREMKRRNVCGAAQKGAPFLYFWVNPDCFKTPDPCKMASLLMHEMGHLARQDTADNEPADFFTACTLLGRCVDPGRGD